MEKWKQEIANSLTTAQDLLQAGLISQEESHLLEGIGAKFKVRITPYYSRLISPDSNCPIRKQALPHLLEQDPQLPDWAIQLSQDIYERPAPWHNDAIGDMERMAAPRLTHRYENRAILHLSTLCALYCRFCFRKSHLNEEENSLYEGSLEPALDYLKKNSNIRELILTGGDPLSITDYILERLLTQLSQIPHIRTVRIHTRMAVTLPYRFTPELAELLGRNWGFQIVIVNHFNHSKELTESAVAALSSLKKKGITLLNQSVLLKGVNDQPECLAALFQSLYENGVIPYYLHHPDWTPGTFHFRVSIDRGKQIYRSLRGLVSGPCLPEYVLDIPQGYGKVSISDHSFQKIREISNPTGISGAVYEMTSPHTRSHKNQKITYLDLF